MPNTFGERLREARLKQGLTQYTASELVFGTRDRQGDISRWESGSAKPGLDVLAQLSLALKVSADELIHGTHSANEGENVN